jgi:choline dehydrogenase-like flavoprotein
MTTDNLGDLYLNGRGDLTHIDQAYVNLKSDIAGQIDLMKNIDSSDWTDFQIEGDPFIIVTTPRHSLAQFFEPADLQAWKDYFRPYLGQYAMNVRPSVMKPKSRGTIRLASTNPYDYPLIDPNYASNPEDVKILVEGSKKLLLAMTSERMRKLGVKPFPPIPGCAQFFSLNKWGKYAGVPVDAYLECAVRKYGGSDWHMVGSCRMGSESDPLAVVDPQLRVIGVSGLRVVDASVMPVVTTGNTRTPTNMIGEKAADMIKREW